MFIRRSYVFSIFLVLCAIGAHGQSLPSQFININAENLENKVVNGQEVMILTGNVRFTHGMINGSSDKATQYKALNKVILEGNVEIRQDVMLLKAPNVEYDGISSNAKAENGVYLSDRDASVTARKGYYNLNLQKADFEGNVKTHEAFILPNDDRYYTKRNSWIEPKYIINESKTKI